LVTLDAERDGHIAWLLHSWNSTSVITYDHPFILRL